MNAINARRAIAYLLLLVCMNVPVDSMCATLADFDRFIPLPLIRQGTTYTCGVAALHSVLRWRGYDWDINDETLAAYCGTTPESGTPCEPMLAYLAETGGFDATWRENMTVDDLKAVIDGGGVAMLPLQAWEFHESASGEWTPFETEDYRDHWLGGHWVVACGYNETAALFMDPATAGCYTMLSWDALDVRWHDSADFVDASLPFTKYEHCAIVVYRTDGEGYDANVVQPLG